jgi:hypothetical protein
MDSLPEEDESRVLNECVFQSDSNPAGLFIKGGLKVAEFAHWASCAISEWSTINPNAYAHSVD